MKIYLIAIQMLSEGRRTRSVRIIQSIGGGWARITNTAWCIKVANTTTAEIRNKITSQLDIQSDERLIVVDITNSSWASYYLPKDVADWLKQ